MRRILMTLASACLLGAVALPSGIALAQSEAPQPTPTPEITQPPAQNLGEQCQNASAGGASAAPLPTGGVNEWAAGISGPVTISGWQSTGAEGDALTQTLCAAQARVSSLRPDSRDHWEPALQRVAFARLAGE